MNFKLSIVVVTMNRVKQLQKAIESCLDCNLPLETNFVVIDNASTDNTEEVIRDFFKNIKYPLYYEKMPENLGVGGGRNYAFSKAKGEYVYVLDDDAVISDNKEFFNTAVRIMENNRKIMTLTTQIYDMAWGKNRLKNTGREISPGIFKCKMFCGGSHFLRRTFFSENVYLPNKYGYEELLPSLKVADAGGYNVFCPELLIIHKPLVNKWNFNDKRNFDLLINECAVPYAIKQMMYPRICLPILFIAHAQRRKRYLKDIPDGCAKCTAIVGETVERYPIRDRIKFRTVINLYKEFGISIF